HGRRPAPRSVQAIVVLGPTREERRDLARQVDTGAAPETPAGGVFNVRREAELQPQLVEVDVAALSDGAVEVEVAVSLRLPATEVPVAVLEPATTGNGHVGAKRCDAALQRHRRDRQFPD